MLFEEHQASEVILSNPFNLSAAGFNFA